MNQKQTIIFFSLFILVAAGIALAIVYFTPDTNTNTTTNSSTTTVQSTSTQDLSKVTQVLADIPYDLSQLGPTKRLGDIVYLKAGNTGIAIIDISAPKQPRPVSIFANDVGVNDIYFSDNKGYITTGGMILTGDRHYKDNLIIFDVHDPLHPLELGRYEHPTALLSGLGSIVINGTYAYVTDYEHEVLTFDVSDPTHIKLVGTFKDNFSSSGPIAIVSYEKYLYVAVGAPGVMILDASQPASLRQIGTYKRTTKPGEFSYVEDLSISGRYLFIADYQGLGLTALDISNPTEPKLLGTQFASFSFDSSNQILLSDDRAYVMGGGTGCSVLDISVPGKFPIISSACK